MHEQAAQSVFGRMRVQNKGSGLTGCKRRRVFLGLWGFRVCRGRGLVARQVLLGFRV